VDPYFGAELTKICNIWFLARKHFKWGFVFECTG
jgi:hypothetical protein